MTAPADAAVTGLTGLTEIPAGLLLIASEFFRSHDPLRDAARGSAVGVVAMVPEGLVLLTSLAFAAGALRLARRRVLVQELAAIEGLARADVLCIDLCRHRNYVEGLG